MPSHNYRKPSVALEYRHNYNWAIGNTRCNRWRTLHEAWDIHGIVWCDEGLDRLPGQSVYRKSKLCCLLTLSQNTHCPPAHRALTAKFHIQPVKLTANRRPDALRSQYHHNQRRPQCVANSQRPTQLQRSPTYSANHTPITTPTVSAIPMQWTVKESMLQHKSHAQHG